MLPVLIAFGQPFPEINIVIPKGSQRQLEQSTESGYPLVKPVLMFNGYAVPVKKIHTRGKSSIQFSHKSLAIELKEDISFGTGEQSRSLNQFDLLNLAMDKDLWHNRWAYMMMDSLGIFPLYSTYCKLKINGEPQGIYLLVEKPVHAAKRLESPYMVRRGMEGAVDGEHAWKTPADSVKKFRRMYQSVYRAPGLPDGASYLTRLEGALETQSYFRWMAFNYLVMNGDYSDEVFLYIRPASGKFAVIPWDYDDIFRAAPHEGLAARSQTLNHRLVFSVEDPLDKAIASNDMLYQHYLSEFRATLMMMSERLIRDSFQVVQNELTGLAEDREIASSSLYIGKEPFTLEAAIIGIQKAEAFLLSRILTTKKDLESAVIK